MRNASRAGVALLSLTLVASCASGGSNEDSPSGADRPDTEVSEPADGVPAGGEKTVFTDWTDPRPAEWAEAYPRFAPVTVGDGSLARVQEAGELVICANLGMAPWNSINPETNEIEGLDVRFRDEILQRIGVAEARYTNVEFQAIIPALQGKQCDVAMSSLGIRADRGKEVKFTIPYAMTFDQFAVLQDSPMQKADDLAGMKVGTFAGTADEDVLRAWVADEQNGVTIHTYNTPNECFLAVVNKIDDACFTDQVAISAAKAEYTDLRSLPDAFPYAAGFPDDAKDNPYILLAIANATRHEDGDLNLAISLAIQDIIDSGLQQEILEEFDLWAPEQSVFIRSDA